MSLRASCVINRRPGENMRTVWLLELKMLKLGLNKGFDYFKASTWYKLLKK